MNSLNPHSFSAPKFSGAIIRNKGLETVITTLKEKGYTRQSSHYGGSSKGPEEGKTLLSSDQSHTVTVMRREQDGFIAIHLSETGKNTLFFPNYSKEKEVFNSMPKLGTTEWQPASIAQIHNNKDFADKHPILNWFKNVGLNKISD